MGELSKPGAEDVPDTQYREERSVLPDGTEYLMRLPEKWNGTLVRDLDFVTRSVDSVTRSNYSQMLCRGFAVAGTARHRLRMYQYDPVREIANLDKVLDRFASRFGKPHRVIQYGCSGGGHLTLAVSESFHERVDAAVALAAHTPVWLMNTFLDGWFALKYLIGPEYEKRGHGKIDDLLVVDLPNDGSAHVSAHGRTGVLPEAWRKAVDIAQESPLGRARIALAFTLGQWPAWVNNNVPYPDFDNAEALQLAMYHAAYQNAANPGGEARIMFENAAHGQQLSWNTGVDYKAFFEAGSPYFKRAVLELYDAAGANHLHDIDRVNNAPRIEKSDYALEFWSKPGRTIWGKPAIPLVRLHMVGDYQIPHSLVQGYEETLAATGSTDLARTLFLKATGHCNFNAAEAIQAINLVLQRLENGNWAATDANAVNGTAMALDAGSEPRFFAIGPHRQTKYNRIWLA